MEVPCVSFPKPTALLGKSTNLVYYFGNKQEAKIARIRLTVYKSMETSYSSFEI